MRISDWSSDGCSSDLLVLPIAAGEAERSTTLHSLIKTIVSPYDDPAADAPSRIALSGCDPEIAGRAVTEIGRASCRARVCQYVEISLVAVSLKRKRNILSINQSQVRQHQTHSI